jgi:hypothetical protein
MWADRRTDRRDEANSRFSKILRTGLKGVYSLSINHRHMARCGLHIRLSLFLPYEESSNIQFVQSMLPLYRPVEVM